MPLIFQIGGRTIKSSIAVDNGRSTEFIRRRDYPDKSRCYECGEEGHLSYQCTANTLGPRTPPPKKIRKRNLKSKGSTEAADTSFYDSDSDEGVRKPRGTIEEKIPEEYEAPYVESWSYSIKCDVRLIIIIN